MERFGTKEFTTKKEMFSFISENKEQLIAQKKAAFKQVDCSVYVAPTIVREKTDTANKEGNSVDPVNLDKLKVVVVINTTNFMDTCDDVHIPGLWGKSLAENKMIMHLQEHEMEFESIISDGPNLKAYTKPFTWVELGYDFEGTTEALVFESTIERKRNEFMLNQYANKWVRNHSVGMWYVKVDIAINDPDCLNEFASWQKYYPMIANKDRADQLGYFWYVLEAKCIEGSAVPLGANTCTPTLDFGIDKSQVVCESCGHKFAYESVPEAGMGYCECPKCGSPVTPNMKSEPSLGTRHKSEPAVATQSKTLKFLATNLKIN